MNQIAAAYNEAYDTFQLAKAEGRSLTLSEKRRVLHLLVQADRLEKEQEERDRIARARYYQKGRNDGTANL